MSTEDMMKKPVKDQAREYLSPSGAYKLVVTPHNTKEGCWDYTEGLVYRKGEDKPIQRVCRNYSSFPFMWLEDHPKGAFLICGEDYQGQTVIELGTGERRDYLPEEAKEGHGFCWADYKYEPSMALLVVGGCYWAAPYEYKFYDFSDPMSGWPLLEIMVDGEKSYVDEDIRPPTFEGGQIKVYQTESDEGEQEDDDGKILPMAAYKIFKRVGDTLEQVESWVSDKEKARRIEQKEGQKRYAAKVAKFKAEDPLYLAHRKLVEDPALLPSEYESRGITHESWCPDFDKREGRHCRRIVESKHPSGYTVDLEWAVETGPIKLQIFKDGDSFEDLFFEHSVEGMEKAYAHVVGLVS